MQVALWDFPVADCLEAAARTLPCEIERHDGATCRALLREQQVDIALVPMYYALTAGTDLVILPGGAVSSWGYPYSRLQLNTTLHDVQTFRCARENFQEALMARIILKEHYGVDASPIDEGRSDAQLLVGPESLALVGDPSALDLGQEWYELLQYPMVWALYTCAPGAATPAMVSTLRTLTKRAEEIAHTWGEQADPVVSYFFRNSLRLRLDDLAMAGLAGIQEYLYYYGVKEEMGELPLYEPPQAHVSEPVPPWV